jgi:predicted MFS family arabinose efflux permease
MSAVAERRAGTFSALRHRNFRVFWTGFLVSMTGNWMQMFALGWLVVELAERDGVPERAALYAGLVGFARLLPALGLGLVAGAVVDRVDRRKVLLVEESCALAIAVSLAALTLTDTVTVAWVIGFAALGAAATAFESLTRSAILPGLAGPDLLVSAVGLNSSAVNLSVLLGPLLGGLLIVSVGIGGLMLVNAATFLASLWSLAYIPEQRVVDAGPRVGVVASIRAGLAFVRETPFVRWQLLLLATVTILGNPLSQLLPAFVSRVLDMGAVELSWLAAAGGAGGLVATLVAPMVGARRGRGLVFIVSTLCAGLGLMLFGVQRSLLPAFALMLAVEFAMTVGATLCMMITQLTTPDHLRGRVISVQQLIVEAGIPGGTLLLGASGSVIGVGAAVAWAGAVVALTSVVVLVRAPLLRAVA